MHTYMKAHQYLLFHVLYVPLSKHQRGPFKEHVEADGMQMRWINSPLRDLLKIWCYLSIQLVI